MTGRYFEITNKTDIHPNNDDFKLHNHNGYEIYMFISGDAEFIAEGTIYPLQPYDIMIVRNDELHHVHHLSDAEYKRIVIDLDTAFFTAADCEKYKAVFLNRSLGRNNKIASGAAGESGLSDAVSRLVSYSEGDADETVVSAVITEILFLLNKNHIGEDVQKIDSTVSSVISYINSNIAENLSLDRIASKFYISKYHLCKTFKAATGYTVNGYINYKRILLVKELCSSGSNISTACMAAGFKNYSNFYKIYLKETGHTPKEDLKGKKRL